jgi:hypothetical protein
VSSTSLTPDEIRAAAETHSELGPEYQSAVIDSFIDKVGKEIDARVDARMRSQQPAPYPGPYQFQGQLPVPRESNPAKAQFALAIVSMALGIPLSAITLGNHAGNLALFIVWLSITAINVAYAFHSRPPSSSR